MMIEFGVLLFGLLTGNLILSVAWILLKMANFIPLEYEGLTVLVIILFSIGRKILKVAGT